MTPLMRHAFSHDEETRQLLAGFIVSSDRLSMGPLVSDFEVAWAERMGRAHGVMTNSGSSANLILLQAMLNEGLLQAGDRVAVSAVTWATNVMPVMQLGLTPVPIDVDVETLNMHCCDEADTVFATNALGFCPELGEFNGTLIVDSCEGVGGELDGRPIGSFGLASTFSFFIGHHLSTIEGGMVCTDDDDFADALRMARANGWDRNVSERKRCELRSANRVNDFNAAYTFYAPAYNVRPTEIQGFLGLNQLQYLDENCERRAEIYYRLQDAQRFGIKVKTRMSKISPLAFPVVCESAAEMYLKRRMFERCGVEVRPLISGNITKQPFFPTWHELPGADHLHRSAFYCGLHPEMTEDELQTIEGCLS